MVLSFFIKPQNDPTRGQVLLCHNFIVNLFEKGNCPCKQEFLEVRLKRQILDHYLKSRSKITSFYGIIPIEIVTSKTNHITHQIQTNDIDIEISKVFTDYIKIIQRQNSQRQIQYSQTMFFQLSKAIYLYLNSNKHK